MLHLPRAKEKSSSHRASLRTTFKEPGEEQRKLSQEINGRGNPGALPPGRLHLHHQVGVLYSRRAHRQARRPGRLRHHCREQPSSLFLLQIPGTAARNKCIRIILPCQEEGERGLSERFKRIWYMNERGMADGGGLLPGVRRVWGRFLSLLKTFASCKVQAEPSLPFLEQPKRERWWTGVGWDFFCTAFPYKCI